MTKEMNRWDDPRYRAAVRHQASELAKKIDSDILEELKDNLKSSKG